MSTKSKKRENIKSGPAHKTGRTIRPEIVWHYTTGIGIAGILRARKFMQSTIDVPFQENPAVWLSANPNWEHTASKLWRRSDGEVVLLTKEGTRNRGRGLFRIALAVDQTILHWPRLKKQARMPRSRARFLAKVGRKRGANPWDWYGSLEPVPEERWLSVQRLADDGKWGDVRREVLPSSLTTRTKYSEGVS